MKGRGRGQEWGGREGGTSKNREISGRTLSTTADEGEGGREGGGEGEREGERVRDGEAETSVQRRVFLCAYVIYVSVLM